MWTTVDNVRSCTFQLPEGLALWNLARYTVTVKTTDLDTGLESEPVSATVETDWAHTAMKPPTTVLVDSDELSAAVTVTAPTDYVKGDRFDLYRDTPDGERLIATGLPFGTVVTDRLAPFTKDGTGLAYFAVTRTKDGDSCIGEDAEYTLACGSLRLDWGNESVELPYNITISDEVAKDSEVRKHMDGTSQAYWNEGTSRKASLSTSLVRFDSAETEELLRDMFQYAGSVFVRTPDGLAFAADVQPGTVERSWDNGAVAVSLECTEHALTDEGRPGAKDIAQPQWGGGAVEEHGGVVYDTAGGFPMDDWQFIGYAGTTLYVCDPDGTVRDGTGTEQVDWTWDGEALKDDNGDPVPVTDEPEE